MPKLIRWAELSGRSKNIGTESAAGIVSINSFSHLFDPSCRQNIFRRLSHMSHIARDIACSLKRGMPKTFITSHKHCWLSLPSLPLVAALTDLNLQCQCSGRWYYHRVIPCVIVFVAKIAVTELFCSDCRIAGTKNGFRLCLKQTVNTGPGWFPPAKPLPVLAQWQQRFRPIMVVIILIISLQV